MSTLAVIPGDGIGPEVMAEVLKVHAVVEDAFGTGLKTEVLPYSADWFLEHGDVEIDIPAIGRTYGAVLLGALGDPRIPDNRHAIRIIGGLRQQLELSVNLRPVRLRTLAHCPLKHVRDVGDVDLVVVRENTEDVYVGVGGTVRGGRPGHVAMEVGVHTRWAVDRALEAAFELARSRPRHRLTLVDKSNAMPSAGPLWQSRFRALAASYPDVACDHLYVDAAAMELIRNPARFDVVVASNLFGDILSDEASMLAGGLGVAPSASYDPEDTSFFGVFEAVHGSAPDIAGTGRANPLASVMSYSLMLDRMGLRAAHRAVERAVDEVLRGDLLTPDLGGTARTDEVGDLICRAIARRDKDR
ncbi:isocitrate/isopropylmalate dehydrogenase family protein [Streptomyces avidinii]|uniref:3-isopropylmalate dehydrogenase n=1 Tax=Streptomyces avidinii TaxID=1895 RepID=A0ABS4LEZ8_STRAV|nr:isocitrate/isopropylmalate family dehydrogenase [Streptomyces avidinii]MBP2040575.1 3-isopropylmalate dehydrogenase [Streptomyces avidinii]GGZ30830.1 3-isopropylmalate dehydrogenase [Streptomyces avidinii]